LRALANGFLVLFAADAVVSVMGAALDLNGAESPWPLAPLRESLGGLVILVARPLHALLGLTPRLPWRVFLPLTLFTFWAMLGALPLPVYLSTTEVAAAVALPQLALALVAAAQIRRRTGRRWLLAESDLPAGPVLSGRTAGGFALLHLAGVLPALLVLLLGSAALAIHRQSAGFLRLDTSGLYASARVYERGDRDVHLVAMMHIGDADFYAGVERVLPEDGAIVLREGVTDREGSLPRGLDYGRLAGELGLESQAAVLDLEGRDSRMADLDLSAFDPRTRELLGEIGAVLGSANAREAFVRYLRASRDVTPEDLALVQRDVIERRNEHLLGELDQALEAHRAVVVPWGAAHMPGIEQGVLERGFALRESRELRILPF